jgi:hypothetical protein
MIRTNPGTRPAIYTPDTEGTETVEIADDLMVDAIEKVRRSIARARPKPPKLRGVLSIGLLVAASVAAVVWLPGALMRQTLAVVPEVKRTEIGATILGHFQRITGATCRGAEGTQALVRLEARLFGADASGQIVVVQTLPQGALLLPGGIILIDRALVEQQEDVMVPAGFILAASSARTTTDPLEPVLRQAGLRHTLGLLTTGDLAGEVLSDYATALRDAPPPPLGGDTLIADFAKAEIALAPYLNVRSPDDPAAAALLAQDSMQGREIPLILADRDWVALQNICTL